MRALARWQALAEVGRQTWETLDANVAPQAIVDGAVVLFGARAAALFGAPDDELLAVAGPDGGDLVPALSVATTGAEHAGVRTLDGLSILTVPLRAKGRALGVLAVADGPPRVFDPDDIQVARAFADQAAVSLENVRLYSELRNALAAVEAAQKQTVETARLQAIGQLAAGIAHHLNNIMTVVLGNLQILDRAALPAEIRPRLATAERAVQEAAEVVSRLRSLGRGRPVSDYGLVDLNQIVDAALQTAWARYQSDAEARGIAIRTRREREDVARVQGDATALQEAVVALISNALDALPRGGDLVLRTWEEDGWVRCAVSDNGVGMSPAVVDRAVEPFFTTKGLKRRGLGLSVTHGIVRRHHGTLTIESDEDRGTTVTLSVPVAAPAVPSTSQRPAAPAVGRLRILLVDDEPAVRSIIAELLTKFGHTVVEAAEGPEAVARIERGERFDLVLSDLDMPTMSGWDVIEAVRTLSPTLPVALITGWGHRLDDEDRQRYRPDAILAKPITREELATAISDILQAARERNGA
jgi:signal transduction histidine kinase/ActR/RegA family two-component response regulator